MSGSNSCFLTCIQVSQKVGKVIWYSHLSKNFPQFAVIHTASLIAQLVKNPTAMNETPVRFVGQEETVRTGHGTTDWFQIGKGVHQGCLLSSCLFNLYSEYIIKNARLSEAQSGIKIEGRYLNNFRYADDTTLMAESEEELTSLLRVKKLA